MSSISRTSAVAPNGFTDINTKFVNITTPSYFDTDLSDLVPIPFSYNKGLLDINIQDNVEDIIYNGYEPYGLSSRLVKKMGGTGIVTSLGPNLTLYLQNWLSVSVPTVPGDIGNFSVVGQPIVTKIQQPAKMVVPPGDPSELLDYYQPFSQFNVWNISDNTPSGDDYLIGGSDDDNFSTSWVFQTPLTIRYTADGAIKYLTFTTTFTKNIPFILT